MSHYVPYNLKFLRKKLNDYENNYKKGAPEKIVHEAQMLLKEMNDLEDQGYMKSYNAFVNELNVVERLTNFIEANGKKAILQPKIPERHVAYKDEKIKLSDYLKKLEDYSNQKVTLKNANPLFNDILEYSKQLYNNLKKDTAVIFLLRDTLLPFLAFKEWSKGKITIKPWLIGRKWLGMFPSEQNLDWKKGGIQSVNFGNNDDLYESLYHAIYSSLDDGNKTFSSYVKGFNKYLDEDLSNFKAAQNSLKQLLSTIKEKHILVVETGRIASIPMLLKNIDKRVDFKLFTTIPEFYDVYKNKYFTDEYDKNRLFETIYCQDCLFQISDFKDGEFFVKETSDKEVIKQAKKELSQWNKMIKK